MPSDFDEKIAAIKQLQAIYQTERLVHLGVSVSALLVLFACAIKILFFSDPTAEVIGVGLGMFGSGGMITVMLSRLLTVHNRAIDVVFGLTKGKADD